MCCALVALSVSLTGCGAGDAPTAGTTTAVVGVSESSTPVREAGIAAADSHSPAASTARRVCGPLTPEEVRVRFLSAARAGASKSDRGFLEAATQPPKRLRSSPAYAYVAARVYALSVPKPERAGAYAGCAGELSMKNTKESGR
jgi:hypothetical protein